MTNRITKTISFSPEAVALLVKLFFFGISIATLDCFDFPLNWKSGVVLSAFAVSALIITLVIAFSVCIAVKIYLNYREKSNA